MLLNTQELTFAASNELKLTLISKKCMWKHLHIFCAQARHSLVFISHNALRQIEGHIAAHLQVAFPSGPWVLTIGRFKANITCI